MTLTTTASTAGTTTTDLETLRRRFQPIFDQIAKGALDRELSRTLPYEQVQLLVESGFTALQAPQAYGGEDVSLTELTELLIELATADSNLPQILHAHFAFTEIHRVNPQDISDWWLQQVGAGKIISNGMVAGPQPEEVTGPAGAQTYTGSKIYSTGALFSDYLFVVTGQLSSGAPRLHVVPTQHDSVELVDDWDGIGQRLTGSGTTHFAQLPLAEDYILDITSPAGTLTGPLVFLIHAATQAGIAANAVADAAAYVRNRRRTYGHAATALPKDDPQVQEVIGRAASHAYAARAVVRDAARDLAARLHEASLLENATPQAAEAIGAAGLVEAGQFAAVVSDHTQDATTLLFEAGGASVLQRKYGFDRHWRNARVLASHNPAHFKLRTVGDYFINGTLPTTDFTVRDVQDTTTEQGENA